MKKFNNVYIVINEGEVVYASVEKENADAYADGKNQDSKEDVLKEWDIDDPDEKDSVEAAIQAGYDGDYYKVFCINLKNKSEDDSVELDDGTEIDVSDIVELLKRNK